MKDPVTADGFYERYWAVPANRPKSDFFVKWPKLQKHIPREAGKVIVDFGCGTGELLREMAKLNPGAKYVGLDVSAAALAAAATSAPQAELHQIADGARLPLDDGMADFILASEVLEHVHDTPMAFAELARLLRPDGHLLVTVPYHGLLKNLLLVLFRFDAHFSPTKPHIRFFTRKSLCVCLRAVGLTPERFEYCGRCRPLSRSLIVLARKKVAEGKEGAANP